MSIDASCLHVRTVHKYSYSLIRSEVYCIFSKGLVVTILCTKYLLGRKEIETMSLFKLMS